MTILLFKFILLPVTSLFISFTLWYDHNSLPYQYQSMWLLPITFFFINVLFFSQIDKNKARYKMTIYPFYILLFLRLVTVPLVIYLSKNYEYLSYIQASAESINLAIYLLIIEAMLSSLFLYIYLMKYSMKGNKGLKSNALTQTIGIRGSIKTYILFITSSVFILITSGKMANLINFLVIEVKSDSLRFGDADNTLDFLLKQMIFLATMFAFLISIDFLSKRYHKTYSFKYYIWSLIIAFLYIGVIIGERRSNQLYIGLLAILLINLLFPTFKKITTIILAVSMGSVILIMSIYKHFYVFSSGSYVDSIRSSEFNLNEISNTLQLYFLGIDNIALSIEFSKIFNGNLLYPVYENIRSTFGMSFIFGDWITMTSSLFNSYIYNSHISNGHLLSSAGYGYIHLGILFFLISIFNLIISLKFEEMYNLTESLELKFLFAFVVLRFSTNIFSSTPPLINLSTIVLFTGGAIFIVSVIINKNSKNPFINKGMI